MARNEAKPSPPNAGDGFAALVMTGVRCHGEEQSDEVISCGRDGFTRLATTSGFFVVARLSGTFDGGLTLPCA
ncbi:MAG: hypothetical protein NZT92_18050 [Abditibacteriales bacterium]|nr:hypothetical protein [Abditibacteriales bacterium]